MPRALQLCAEYWAGSGAHAGPSSSFPVVFVLLQSAEGRLPPVLVLWLGSMGGERGAESLSLGPCISGRSAELLNVCSAGKRGLLWALVREMYEKAVNLDRWLASLTPRLFILLHSE